MSNAQIFWLFIFIAFVSFWSYKYFKIPYQDRGKYDNMGTLYINILTWAFLLAVFLIWFISYAFPTINSYLNSI